MKKTISLSDGPSYGQKIENYSIDYTNELNKSQLDAALATKGPYLVIAGAGTGKTRTLVYRVAHLVESGVSPRSILLLTFTRKAAREMLGRAEALLDSRCSMVSGGTFHSFANHVLRKYAAYAGLKPNFTILDQSDSEDVINLLRNRLDLKEMKKRFPKKASILKILSLSSGEDRDIEAVIADEYPHFAEFSADIARLKGDYRAYKTENMLLDYDDLLLYLRDFLSAGSPGAMNLLDGIEFVMVDEYQDTNKLQAEIVKLLCQRQNNIMVVGDDSQSIYSFRGADFKNIMEFPGLFEGTRIIKLEDNYRSTEEILRLANYVIRSSAEKYEKELRANEPSGPLPAIVASQNEDMQSRFIVQRILSLREEGLGFNEMAVLFRSSYFSFNLEIELAKAGIPFQKFGGMKFVEASHIKDLLSFLRIAQNPADYVSWLRILLLHEGIGPKKAQRIMDFIKAELIASRNYFSDGPGQDRLDLSSISKTNTGGGLIGLFETLRKITGCKEGPYSQGEIALSYYEPLFKAHYDDFNKRKKDLDTFLNIAGNYRSLDGLLCDMALDPPTEASSQKESASDNDFLTLSTIHSAKGLEWKSLFIINALEGFFPSAMSYGKKERIEEERRLMYVAITRAKRYLCICYPMNTFDRSTGTILSKPSRFIDGIDETIAEEYLVED